MLFAISRSLPCRLAVSALGSVFGHKKDEEFSLEKTHGASISCWITESILSKRTDCPGFGDSAFVAPLVDFIRYRL